TAALVRVLAPACRLGQLNATIACAAAATPPRVPAAPAGSTPARSSEGFIRVNAVGYPGRCPKRALLISRRALAHASFNVVTTGGGVAFTGRVGPSHRGRARRAHAYELGPGSVAAPGRSALEVGGLPSTQFPTGD